MYIIATHAVINETGKDTFGPAHSIEEFLLKKKKKVLFIMHSLYENNGSIAREKGKIIYESKPVKGMLRKSWAEISANWRLISKVKSRKTTFIAVDPINAVSGVLLKMFRRIDRLIYFTPDYADKRFDSGVMNAIYHAMDRLSLKFADENWCVSSRIMTKRKKQGAPESKIKFLPNSPEMNKIPKHTSGKVKKLVIVSNLTKSLHLTPILDSLAPIFKKYPDVILEIIGGGQEENNFKKLVEKRRLQKKVFFVGQKNHDEVLKILSGSYIGFAIYTKENSWNVYGDSMKAREYAACGLPIIINDIPSTADDITSYSAGLVLSTIDKKKITNFITKCLNDKTYYLNLKENALKLGNDFDKDTILKKLLFDDK